MGPLSYIYVLIHTRNKPMHTYSIHWKLSSEYQKNKPPKTGVLKIEGHTSGHAKERAKVEIWRGNRKKNWMGIQITQAVLEV
jgi:hypothetical protein